MNKGIVYQNKDVLFKILGQTYKGKSFQICGLDWLLIYQIDDKVMVI